MGPSGENFSEIVVASRTFPLTKRHLEILYARCLASCLGRIYLHLYRMEKYRLIRNLYSDINKWCITWKSSRNICISLHRLLLRLWKSVAYMANNMYSLLYLNYKTLFAEILCNSLWWKLWNLILCEKGWLCWNITHAYPIIDSTESSGTINIGQITWSGIASKNENRHNTKFVATGGTVVCHYEGIVPSHLVLNTLGKLLGVALHQKPESSLYQICRHWWHRSLSLWRDAVFPWATKLALWSPVLHSLTNDLQVCNALLLIHTL